MEKRSTIFQNSIKSYCGMAALGLAADVITRLTDFFSYDTLWSLSSIATLFGFWMLTTTLVIYHSCSNINAAINAFLYLFAMSFSFYALQAVLGLFLPRFDIGGFSYALFGLYAAMSLVCGIVAFILYFWNKNNRFSSILYALPVGGLLAETLGVGFYLFTHATFLFQFIFDLTAAIALGWWFYKKSPNKFVFIAASVTVAIAGYAVFYKPFL